ncbi:MAG: transposase [Planctomycetaceae bacterium]|nr:transposase [Planctomycetaceae bacterium]
MAKHRKVYRFRMKPTKEQAHALGRMAGARRWVWNWALRRWKEHYAATGKSIPLKQLSAELTALKQQAETAWLRDANAQALQQAIADLHRAFTNFFETRARYPKFKSRKRDGARFRIPQGVKIKDGKVSIPTISDTTIGDAKIGDVRIFRSRDVVEQTKSATFKRAADGKWYVSLVVEFEIPDIPIPTPDPVKTTGIDVGLIDFATFSDPTAEPIPAPKFFRTGQRRLRKAQRTVSRRKHGSRRRAKAVRKAAAVHRKLADQRRDFQHKLSTKIVGQYAAVCVETLSLKGLARTKLAKSFNDAAFGEFFRQLRYKCLWNCKHFIAIDRFFPSSQMCNVCGALNERLTLSDREWGCACGTHHRRDFLAACTIRDEGLRRLAAGQADSLNAQGDSVRPGMPGSCR